MPEHVPGAGTGFPAAPAWLRDVPFAHRGLHGDGVPENSLAAFEAAAAHGYGVELDVHLSSDGVPVVIHDGRLRRTTGLDARVGQLTAAELAGLCLVGSGERVPALAEALRVLREVPVMVEVKQPRPRPGRLEGAVAALLDEHAGPCCVASFNPVTPGWFRRARPQVVRVLTATPRVVPGLPRAASRRLAGLRGLAGVAPHAVSYDLAALPAPATDAWRERGGVLITWTAVGPAGLARARRLADNVIFERVLPGATPSP